MYVIVPEQLIEVGGGRYKENSQFIGEIEGRSGISLAVLFRQRSHSQLFGVFSFRLENL